METRTIRVACFVVFSVLVSARFGYCASHDEEGRALLRYGESERHETTGSLSNWGQGKVFRGVLNLIHHNATPRKLLQARELESSQSSNHEHQNPSTPVQPSESHTLPHWAIYTVPIAGALCIALVAAAMYLLFNRRKKDNTVMPWATGLSGQLSKAFVTGVPCLGSTELEAACESFINVIDTSPDGTMYKGTLSSGVEIAVLSTSVTSAQQWSDRSEEQFKNKILVLSKVNHKNFMNLLGYCACDEPFTRMMVFEYAPCGSLFEHLHIREAEHLDWPTRLRIIMGVAYCLEHMSQLNPPLTPRALSSSSIYLTEDYAAKIADIEFWNDDSKQDTVSSGEIGRSIREQESMVYKFGILLLEVISGRRPFSEDDGLLVLWASSYLDGKRPLSRMADPTLIRSSSAAPEEDVAALCEVARLCIRPETGKRAIGMGEVARLVRGVAALSPEQAAPRGNPLWWAELEIASSETA
ncbi:hypothetical protein ABZP36_008920 [Zizania latifolia]